MARTASQPRSAAAPELGSIAQRPTESQGATPRPWTVPVPVPSLGLGLGPGPGPVLGLGLGPDLALALAIALVTFLTLSVSVAQAQICEGDPFYLQAPEQQALWTQEDPCQPFVIKLADNFPGDGMPVSGFSIWGLYQHPDGQEPESPQTIIVEIYEYLGDQNVGNLLHAEIIDDYSEEREPTQGNLTPVQYCVYLHEFFPTDPTQDYVVSITPVLCGPTQFQWRTSHEGDGESWIFAPDFGQTGWTPLVYELGTPIDLSIEICHPQAGIDITKTIPAWLPEYGNTTTYTATTYWLDPRGGCIAPGPLKKITFSLSPVSSELGYAINMGTEDHTDLHMNHESNGEFVPVTTVTDDCDLNGGPHAHWMSVVTRDCVAAATVTVVSEDHGAFGWIEASGDGCDPIGVVGLEPREPGGGTVCALGTPRVKIPRDDDGNDIADVWAGNSSNGNNIPTWDAETQPNPQSNRTGDGLTRYEEYRGAYGRAGTHNRFSTLRKDIAIYRENTAWGVEDIRFSADWFDVLPDQINGARHDDRLGTVNAARLPRVFNFNRTSHTNQDQNGLWLAVSGGDGVLGNWGLARDNLGASSGPIGGPDNTGRVEVYVNNITGACQLRSRGNFRWGVGRRGVISAWTSDGRGRQNEIIMDTIGHEMGHAHGHQHHRGQRIWISQAPRFGADGWLNLNAAPINYNRVFTSARGMNTCVMQYKFHNILQAVALRYRPVQEWYYSADSDWTPTVPTNNFGYGASCSCLAGTPCIRNSQIRD